jgi:hypothetical protein
MPEYTDKVTVLRGHLEDWHRTLDAAYGNAAAEDLARAYTTMNSGTHRPSNLTRALQSSLERVEGYLTEGDDVVSGAE